MNNREETIKQKYEKEGWRMMRGGAPDFIAIKVDDGNIIEFKGVEVKKDGAGLTYEQAIYQKLFELAHIPFVVEVQGIPSRPIQSNHSKLIHSKPSQSPPNQIRPIQPTPNQSTPNQKEDKL